MSISEVGTNLYGRCRSFWRWIPAVVWMGTIFSASTDLMAHNNTSKYVQPLLHWLFPHASPDFYSSAHMVIRKGGHVTEYAILASLLVWALGRRPLLALLLCVLYAAGDEWHQSFVPSRTGAMGDVIIDTCGALAAIVFWMGWLRFRERRRSKRMALEGQTVKV